ncbi:thioredoxin-dependent thiol peroxidase [Candidatus Sumerlaeota bacterium]|nr:thioredoxin-dependent thiol peroxidase [Candidatus Sumerlaeota bacterium]
MKVGDKAPEFCLPNRHAQHICLKDFFGKWVVLYFYPKDNSPGCTLEAMDFTKNMLQFEDLNTVVLGISPDSVRSHFDFTLKHKLNIILLSDKEKNAMKKYGVWKEKQIYGKTQVGLVRSTFLINPGGNIVHIWENVRVNGHVQDVLNTLKELKAKK